jgi:hypothetical protein
VPVRRLTRSPLFPALVALGCGYVLFDMSLFGSGRSDYTNEAQASFLALQHGHLGSFVDHLPAYGGSLLLRAPLFLIPGVGDAGHQALFRIVSAPGLLALLGFGMVLWASALRAGVGRNGAWAALLLGAGNFLAISALRTGHSEELLVAVAVALAGLAAVRQRPVPAAVLLGLAIGMKPWAAVAVGPVALTLQSTRWRFLGVSGAIGALLLAPVLLRGGASLTMTTEVARHAGTTFKPWQLFWFLGHDTGGWRVPPAWIASASHPLVVLAPLLICLARPRLLAGRGRYEGLLLLAFALFLRCNLDTWNNAYYLLPAVLVLGMWEILSLRRAPRLAWAVTAMMFLWASVLRTAVSGDVQALIYLSWMLPLMAGLSLRLFAPARFSALRARLPPLQRAERSKLATAGA